MGLMPGHPAAEAPHVPEPGLAVFHAGHPHCPSLRRQRPDWRLAGWPTKWMTWPASMGSVRALAGTTIVRRLPVRESMTIKVIAGIPCGEKGREREPERAPD